MECPNCRLISPPGALRCDCGWDLTARAGSSGIPLSKRSWLSSLLPRCAFCGNRILFGGRRDSGGIFCSPKCASHAEIVHAARQVPEDVVTARVAATHAGRCPECGGLGPVDLHTSYRVWSAIIVTSWSSHPRVSCRRCAVKAKLEGVIISGILGWWGIPWGPLLTPIQMGRNLVGCVRRSPSSPSVGLISFVRSSLASEAAARARPSIVMSE
jgi:hypothetical protein